MIDRETAPPEVTDLLRAWNGGDRCAFDRLIPMVVGELRRVARHHLAKERTGHSLEPTALVNEVYLRWSRRMDFSWQSRAHFFAFAGAEIRHILVAHARRKKAAKRGGGKSPLRLVDVERLGREPLAVDLIDLDRALRRLEEMDPQMSRLVELRYFAGFTAAETAEILGVTERTVLRHWAWIRAWLWRQLNSAEAEN